MDPGASQQEIIAFVAAHLAAEATRLRADTSLFHDLGVDGTDGWDFLDAYAQRFGVDMSSLNVDLHFGPEAAFNPVAYLYFQILKPEKLRFVPITIQHLTNCALSKKWVTPKESPRR